MDVFLMLWYKINFSLWVIVKDIENYLLELEDLEESIILLMLGYEVLNCSGSYERRNNTNKQ